MAKQLCFATATDLVCVTTTPLSFSQQPADVLVTQGIFGSSTTDAQAYAEYLQTDELIFDEAQGIRDTALNQPTVNNKGLENLDSMELNLRQQAQAIYNSNSSPSTKVYQLEVLRQGIPDELLNSFRL